VQVQLNGGVTQFYGPHHFSTSDYATWEVISFQYTRGSAKISVAEVPEYLRMEIEADEKLSPPKR
jgi:hypothetical protein